MRKVVAAILLIAPSMFGCSCGGPVGVGHNISPWDNALDFGQVFLGEKLQKSVVLTLDGVTTTLALVPETVPRDFTVDLTAHPSLKPGDKLEVTVTFAPSVLGPQQGDIVIQAPNTGSGKVLLHVTGVGRRHAIQLEPTELDFGTVLIGTSKTLPMVVTNLVNSDVHVTIGSDDPSIHVDPPTLDLAALGASTIQVTFTPTSRGLLQGPHLHFGFCQSCDTVDVAVKAMGAIEEFTLIPTPLDFGTHSPGSTTCTDEVIKNTGDVPIRFNSIVADAAFKSGNAFELNVGNLLDGATTLAPKATANVQICFKPEGLAKVYSGRVNFTTVTNMFGTLQVTGRGGSAQIVCQPDPLDFGVTTPDVAVTRQMLCRNLGEPEDFLLKTISADVADSLRFDYSQDGIPRDFNVGRADFHFAVSFMASVPGSYAPIVTLTLAKAGSPTDDAVRIPTAATVVDGQPCTLSVKPLQVRFGFVSYQASHTRDLKIVNTDPTSSCTVWGFGLDAAQSSHFSLQGAPEGIASIPAGGSLDLTVTYAPTGPSLDLDVETLTFQQLTAGGMDPTVQVPISAFAGALAGSVQPYPIDFGIIPIPYVKHLAVSLDNLGARPIHVGGNRPTPNPAGDIAPSADSSPAFAVEDLPGRWPYSLGAGGSLTFAASFAPTSPGDYEGELEIWLQNTPAPILVEMRGIASSDPCGELCNAPTAVCPGIQSTWANAAVTLGGAGFDQQDSSSVTCHWDLLNAPPVSAAMVDNADQCATAFRPDAEGEYAFQLTVKNAKGYTDSCQTKVQAKNFLGLWIETTWSAADDIDLHLFHPLAGDPLSPGTWFSLPYDCNYSNQNPYWDTAARSDDPSLDRDDEVGTGPENIRIDVPSSLHTYEIGVHWFGDANRVASETVTTRVFCAGSEAAELTTVLDRQYMAADVATVTWNPDGTCNVRKNGSGTLTVIP